MYSRAARCFRPRLCAIHLKVYRRCFHQYFPRQNKIGDPENVLLGSLSDSPPSISEDIAVDEEESDLVTSGLQLPPLTVGDYVELRRFDKIMNGVLLELPSSMNSRFNQCSMIMAKGQIHRFHILDVTFYIPRWAFSDPVRNDKFPTVSPVSDVAYELIKRWNAPIYVEKGLQIPAHIHHNLERIKSAADAYIIESKAQFEAEMAKLQSQNVNHTTVDELAHSVFGVKRTDAQLFATYLWIMKQPKRFDVSDARGLCSHRRVRVRSAAEREYIDWLSHQVLSIDSMGEKPLKKPIEEFLEKAGAVIRHQRSRSPNAADHAKKNELTQFVKEGNAQMPSFVSIEPEKFRSKGKDRILCSWSENDLKFIRCLIEYACCSQHFPSPYRSLALRLIKHIPCYPVIRSEYKDGEVQFLLKELGIFAPWEDMSALLSATGGFAREFLYRREGLTRFLDRDYSQNPPKLLLDQLYKASNQVAELMVKKTTGDTHTEQFPKKELDKLVFVNRYAGKPLKDDFYKEDPLESLRVEVSETVFTIDDPTARELDDGVSISPAVPNPQGIEDYWLHVHIADPTSLIPHDSLLAAVSQFRATSVYLPSRHWAMMPEMLSDKLFNLGTCPCALTFSARLGSNGDIANYKIQVTHLKSVKLCSYDSVDSVISWDKMYGFKNRPTNSPWVTQYYDARSNATGDASLLSTADRGMLNLIQKFTNAHMKFRVDNGAIVFDKPEYTVSLKPYPLPLAPGGEFGAVAREYAREFYPTVVLDGKKASQLSPSKIMVAEAMIMAGRIASRFCYEHKLPVVYRAQASVYEHCLEHRTQFSALDVGRVDPKGFKPSAVDLVGIIERAQKSRCLETGTIPFLQHHSSLFSLLPSGRPTSIPEKQASLGIPGVENLALGGPRAPDFAFVTSPGVLSTNLTNVSARVLARKELDKVVVGYNKVTSPLRRFGDLVSHWQIKGQLLKMAKGNQKALVFTQEMVDSLLLPLHASEKFAKNLSVKSNRFWALDWVKRREILLGRKQVSLSTLEMPSLGTSVWDYESTSESRKAASGAVYTAYVVAQDDITGACFVILLELGGLQAKIPGIARNSVSQSKKLKSKSTTIYEPGATFPVVVSRVIPSFGLLEVARV